MRCNYIINLILNRLKKISFLKYQIYMLELKTNTIQGDQQTKLQQQMERQQSSD